MTTNDFKIGDRVRWTGEGTANGGPDHFPEMSGATGVIAKDGHTIGADVFWKVEWDNPDHGEIIPKAWDKNIELIPADRFVVTQPGRLFEVLDSLQGAYVAQTAFRGVAITIAAALNAEYPKPEMTLFELATKMQDEGRLESLTYADRIKNIRHLREEATSQGIDYDLRAARDAVVTLEANVAYSAWRSLYDEIWNKGYTTFASEMEGC